jgi:hypothetical protein
MPDGIVIGMVQVTVRVRDSAQAEAIQTIMHQVFLPLVRR